MDYSKTHTKLRLSRDILIYLVDRHDAYLPVTPFRDGSKIWTCVANDYNRITNGLFSNKDANELNGKWRNILYHARKFGYPHPLESQKNGITETELIERVERLKSSQDQITEPSFCQDSLSSKTLNKDEKYSPLQKDRIKIIETKNPNKSQSISFTKRVVKINPQKKGSLLELELQQEKLRMLKETNKIKHSKLLIELERAKLELEKEKYQLAISKDEARKRGLLD